MLIASCFLLLGYSADDNDDDDDDDDYDDATLVCYNSLVILGEHTRNKSHMHEHHKRNPKEQKQQLTVHLNTYLVFACDIPS